MDKKYHHQIVEKNKYQEWLTEKLFEHNPNSKKPKYCIVLPPPNITGKLHLGHAWDGTIQDVLIRYHRLKGFETLFVPGTDHAGIATQVKVMERIAAIKKIPMNQINKTEFLTYAHKWQGEYQAVIHQQWAKIGLALDYSAEKFTLAPEINETVNQVFVKLYEKNLIYRGYKLVNWDPTLQTAISNIEVIYEEQNNKLYYLKYYLADKSNFLVIATTRPETMFADQAVIVNSKDNRYQSFIGKQVINPANQQLIPVIADDYVDIEFGTGAMKCTPAHDFNDYELGLKYHLKLVNCMNQDGSMNQIASKYQKLDRFACRQQLIADLQAQALVVKITDYVHQVGLSQRTKAVIEPYLSEQWFIKMDHAAKVILEQQKNPKAKTEFVPPLFEEQLNRWLNNIQDWCISRQLWWGHQLPVWYHKTTKAVYVGVKPPKHEEEYTRDPDVLDTWFSSALWPLVTLDWPNLNNHKFQAYYPTNVLVTAYDILFFWVVKMMFMGLELTSMRPFNHVLIHGLIRDEQGQKMSKSLNNGVDPNIIIDEYGADALRYFLMSNCASGQDLRFSSIKIKAAWNLINKLWNAARYVITESELIQTDLKIDALSLSSIDNWIIEQFQGVQSVVMKHIEKYEFSLACHELANFIWNQYCALYIELSKYNLQQEDLKVSSIITLKYVLTGILQLLHPFIPFVTEDLYQRLDHSESILKSTFIKPIPIKNPHENTLFVNHLIAIITAIRDIRQKLSLKFNIPLQCHLNTSDNYFEVQKTQLNHYLLTLTNCQIVTISAETLEHTEKITAVITGAVIEIKTANLIDKKSEIKKIEAELIRIEAEINRSQSILRNQQFLAKAPKEKVKLEETKLINYEKQKQFLITKLEEQKQTSQS